MDMELSGPAHGIPLGGLSPPQTPPPQQFGSPDTATGSFLTAQDQMLHATQERSYTGPSEFSFTTRLGGHLSQLSKSTQLQLITVVFLSLLLTTALFGVWRKFLRPRVFDVKQVFPLSAARRKDTQLAFQRSTAGLLLYSLWVVASVFMYFSVAVLIAMYVSGAHDEESSTGGKLMLQLQKLMLVCDDGGLGGGSGGAVAAGATPTSVQSDVENGGASAAPTTGGAAPNDASASARSVAAHASSFVEYTSFLETDGLETRGFWDRGAASRPGPGPSSSSNSSPSNGQVADSGVRDRYTFSCTKWDKIQPDSTNFKLQTGFAFVYVWLQLTILMAFFYFADLYYMLSLAECKSLETADVIGFSEDVFDVEEGAFFTGTLLGFQGRGLSGESAPGSAGALENNGGVGPTQLSGSSATLFDVDHHGDHHRTMGLNATGDERNAGANFLTAAEREPEGRRQMQKALMSRNLQPIAYVPIITEKTRADIDRELREIYDFDVIVTEHAEMGAAGPGETGALQVVTLGAEDPHRSGAGAASRSISQQKEVRTFKFKCVRYVYDEGKQSFVARKERLEHLSMGQLKQRFFTNRSSPSMGKLGLGKLTYDRVETLQQHFGKNRIEPTETKTFLKCVYSEFTGTFMYVFQVQAACLFIFLGSWVVSAIYELIYFVSGTLNAYYAYNGWTRIMEMSRSNTRVRTWRKGYAQNAKPEFYELSSDELLPGDVIEISDTGMVIPCECLLVHGSVLMDESSLTGESTPMEKEAAEDISGSSALFDGFGRAGGDELGTHIGGMTTARTTTQKPLDPSRDKTNMLFAGTEVISVLAAWRGSTANPIARGVTRGVSSSSADNIIQPIDLNATGENINPNVPASPDVSPIRSAATGDIISRGVAASNSEFSDYGVYAIVTGIGTGTLKGDLIRTMFYPLQLFFEFDHELRRAWTYLACLQPFVAVALFLTVKPFQDDAHFDVIIGLLATAFTAFAQLINPMIPTMQARASEASAFRLEKNGVGCIEPDKIPQAGKVNLFCFDKTGTLTKEGMDFYGVCVNRRGPKAGSLGAKFAEVRRNVTMPEMGVGAGVVGTAQATSSSLLDASTSQLYHEPAATSSGALLSSSIEGNLVPLPPAPTVSILDRQISSRQHSKESATSASNALKRQQTSLVDGANADPRVKENFTEVAFDNSYDFNKQLIERREFSCLFALACCHSLSVDSANEIIGNPLEKEALSSVGWSLQRGVDSRGLVVEGLGQTSFNRTNAFAGFSTSASNMQALILRKWKFDQSRQLQVVVCCTENLVRPDESKVTVFAKGSMEAVTRLCLPAAQAPPEGSGGSGDSFSQTEDAVAVGEVAVGGEHQTPEVSLRKQASEQNRILLDLNTTYASRGFYVLGLAQAELSLPWSEIERVSLDDVLTRASFEYLGMALFRNELRAESYNVIRELKQANVHTVMITGDSVYTGIAISKQVGLVENCPFCITTDDEDGLPVWEELDGGKTRNNHDLDQLHHLLKANNHGTQRGVDFVSCAMNSAAFVKMTTEPGYAHLWHKLQPYIQVYGRIKPDGKRKVIRFFQDRSSRYVIAMAGDGGNDTGALKQAHVGIALVHGRKGTAAAAEEDGGSSSKSSSEGTTTNVVAPFVATNSDISKAPEILKEGRACLDTNISSFYLLTIYGVTWVFLGKVWMQAKLSFATWLQFALLDFVCALSMPMALTYQKKRDVLSTTTPNAALAQFDSWMYMLSVFGANFVFFFLLQYHLNSVGIAEAEKPSLDVRKMEDAMPAWYSPVSVAKDGFWYLGDADGRADNTDLMMMLFFNFSIVLNISLAQIFGATRRKTLQEEEDEARSSGSTGNAADIEKGGFIRGTSASSSKKSQRPLDQMMVFSSSASSGSGTSEDEAVALRAQFPVSKRVSPFLIKDGSPHANGNESGNNSDGGSPKSDGPPGGGDSNPADRAGNSTNSAGMNAPTASGHTTGTTNQASRPNFVQRFFSSVSSNPYKTAWYTNTPLVGLYSGITLIMFCVIYTKDHSWNNFLDINTFAHGRNVDLKDYFWAHHGAMRTMRSLTSEEIDEIMDGDAHKVLALPTDQIERLAGSSGGTLAAAASTSSTGGEGGASQVEQAVRSNNEKSVAQAAGKNPAEISGNEKAKNEKLNPEETKDAEIQKAAENAASHAEREKKGLPIADSPHESCNVYVESIQNANKKTSNLLFAQSFVPEDVGAARQEKPSPFAEFMEGSCAIHVRLQDHIAASSSTSSNAETSTSKEQTQSNPRADASKLNTEQYPQIAQEQPHGFFQDLGWLGKSRPHADTRESQERWCDYLCINAWPYRADRHSFSCKFAYNFGEADQLLKKDCYLFQGNVDHFLHVPGMPNTEGTPDQAAGGADSRAGTSSTSFLENDVKEVDGNLPTGSSATASGVNTNLRKDSAPRIDVDFAADDDSSSARQLTKAASAVEQEANSFATAQRGAMVKQSAAPAPANTAATATKATSAEQTPVTNKAVGEAGKQLASQSQTEQVEKQVEKTPAAAVAPAAAPVKAAPANTELLKRSSEGSVKDVRVLDRYNVFGLEKSGYQSYSYVIMATLAFLVHAGTAIGITKLMRA
mmetsp:Transcript_27678/g.69785  ORF Transcript_27678/g.69785 Transcript_27678/m.69785 type:complete len:2579 (+) Transcript_27678:87-7823(+)|eukprot:CAMPEP_0178984776 /NCGR_PEP_ID=MMETSP0795-20121207/1799_1 /TAXON_ID=88552 /ORGANISM="Amoebophrya sp., Strain Ameob2" /LENGTH=2578 /DNA_ID=CAMNT_0020675689 /DNA_START=28 /DNA_END=7764 /DNA_ORIENTATION=+